MPKKKPKQSKGGLNINFLKRYDALSAIVIIGGDLTATGGAAGGTMILPVIGNLAVSFAIAIIAGILIFFNELYTSGNIIESTLDALIATFVIAIPTPIGGILLGGGALLNK